MDREAVCAAFGLAAAAFAFLLAWVSGLIAANSALTLCFAAATSAGFWLLCRWRDLISAQRRDLDAARAEQVQSTALAAELRGQIDQAHKRGAEITERSLRRIGADLHDGPAQLLGLVLLKLDELAAEIAGAPGDGKAAKETVDLIRRATSEALDEIRNTARGLILPDIEQVSLPTALDLAVRSHEKRTKTKVLCDIRPLPPHVPLPVTISLYRFVQEALNNAFRHAGGIGQAVSAELVDGMIRVEVSDTGQSFDPAQLEIRQEKLGLIGLKQRLESLGGTLELHTTPGHGTRLVVRFPLVASS